MARTFWLVSHFMEEMSVHGDSLAQLFLCKSPTKLLQVLNIIAWFLDWTHDNPSKLYQQQ